MPVSAFDLIKKGILASSKAPVPLVPISLVGSNSDHSGDTSSIALGYTGIPYEAGDFAIIFSFGDSSSGSFDITGAGTWAEIIDNDEPSGIGRGRSFAIHHKVLTASEADPTSTRTVTQELGASIHVFRGVDNANPFDVVYDNALHSAHGQDDINPIPPGITTATDNAAILTLLGVNLDNVSGFSAPLGFTLGESIHRQNHRNQGVAFQADAGEAGVKPIGAWQNSQFGGTVIADYSAFTLALRRAA